MRKYSGGGNVIYINCTQKTVALYCSNFDCVHVDTYIQYFESASHLDCADGFH